jgi:hypothetical protein
MVSYLVTEVLIMETRIFGTVLYIITNAVEGGGIGIGVGIGIGMTESICTLI